jgi:hypothetical protein
LTRQLVTTREAAEVLGISVEAVRKRIERDQLEYEREDNRVYVYLDDDQTESGRDAVGEGGNALVEALREQVAYLRGVIATRDQELALRAEEVRRRDAALEREQQLTAFFAERLRELETPQTPTKTEPAEPADPVRSEPDREDPERAEPEKVEPEKVEPVPPEPAGTPTKATEQPGRVEEPQPSVEGAQEPGQERRRSWWREFFGFE